MCDPKQFAHVSGKIVFLLFDGGDWPALEHAFHLKVPGALPFEIAGLQERCGIEEIPQALDFAGAIRLAGGRALSRKPHNIVHHTALNFTITTHLSWITPGGRRCSWNPPPVPRLSRHERQCVEEIAQS